MSQVSIRYMIDDVPAVVRFYTMHFGFALDLDASPAFASVSRDGVRLLLSGKTSSGRQPMPDGRLPVPGGCLGPQRRRIIANSNSVYCRDFFLLDDLEFSMHIAVRTRVIGNAVSSPETH